MNRQDISDATGFDSGDMFISVDDVYRYFTITSMNWMYGGNWKLDYPDVDQDILDEMADTVIENRWHCDFDEENR